MSGTKGSQVGKDGHDMKGAENPHSPSAAAAYNVQPLNLSVSSVNTTCNEHHDYFLFFMFMMIYLPSYMWIC